MRYVGVIPARAGSERVPGKNTKVLGNKPLWEWTLNSALKSNLDEIIITTDIQEIWEKIHDTSDDRINLIRRREELCRDNTGMVEVVLNAIPKNYPDITGIVLLQPTTPFRTPGMIDNFIRLHGHQFSPIYSTDLSLTPNGSIYVVLWIDMQYYRSFYGPNGLPVPMFENYENLQIDTKEDWEKAEEMLKKYPELLSF